VIYRRGRGRLGRHILQPPPPPLFLFSFGQITFSLAILFIWYTLFHRNLNLLRNNVEEPVSRIATPMAVFSTVSEHFVLLTVTKFWESWSVLTEGGRSFCPLSGIYVYAGPDKGTINLILAAITKARWQWILQRANSQICTKAVLAPSWAGSIMYRGRHQRVVAWRPVHNTRGGWTRPDVIGQRPAWLLARHLVQKNNTNLTPGLHNLLYGMPRAVPPNISPFHVHGSDGSHLSATNY
jgi:hypothetical protein